MAIQHPYLLFLGDAPDQLAAKTAQGIAHWRPEWCVGQLRLDGSKANLGLADMTLEQGRAAGAKTLVIGVANRGGVFSEAWISLLEQALVLGSALAAGLHNRPPDVPVLHAAATHTCRPAFAVRHPTPDDQVATRHKRNG